jgi:hypothetical protein
MTSVFCATKIFTFLIVLLFFCKRCMFIFVFLFLLIGCAGSVGISLASRVMYILCVCFRCVECRAGTILIVYFGGVGGGTVRIFFSLWFCSGGYGTVGLVRGRWSVFSFRFLQFAVRSFGGWVSLVGNFLCYTFSVGSL